VIVPLAVHSIAGMFVTLKEINDSVAGSGIATDEWRTQGHELSPKKPLESMLVSAFGSASIKDMAEGRRQNEIAERVAGNGKENGNGNGNRGGAEVEVCASDSIAATVDPALASALEDTSVSVVEAILDKVESLAHDTLRDSLLAYYVSVNPDNVSVLISYHIHLIINYLPFVSFSFIHHLSASTCPLPPPHTHIFCFIISLVITMCIP